MTRRILIVDDDEAHAKVLVEALGPLGFEAETSTTGEEAVRKLEEERPFSLVLTDLVMQGVDGFAVLEAAKLRDPATQVLILTGHGGREIAVKAMQQGALYYLEKPADLAELRAKVQRAAEAFDREKAYQDLKRDLANLQGIEGIVGRDSRMVRVVELISQVAPTQASVLVLGESGTGKELVARAIHQISPRKDKPFVALNCGGMSEGTIGSELFGHVKGAYTGAVGDREGKFEYADGGTLFLDEVAEMPVETQVKLLRVLEERRVVPLGTNRSRPVDVRVLAATHQDLARRVEEGTFRKDLYYRLKVVTIELPALRERKQDIPLLAEHFRRMFCKQHDRDVDGFDREVLMAFAAHSWPGNVRELRNVVESMVVRARGNILTVLDLPPELAAESPHTEDPWIFLAGKDHRDVERNHIRVTLETFQGNRQKAASAMGISERTLYRKIKEYELESHGR